MIWVNCKIYKETFGDGVLRIAKACRRVSKKTGVAVVPVVSVLDLWRVKKEVGGPIWIQHVDIFFEGRKTGWISPLQAMALGADGALINHPEHEIPPGKIRQMFAYLRRGKWVSHWQNLLREADKDWRKNSSSFRIMVCVKTKGQVDRWLKKINPSPDLVAYEPPDLISGSVSVSRAKPEMIKKIVQSLPESSVIVGAGVHCGGDVRSALGLGAKGVLVSSAVVKSANPEAVLLDLADGFVKTKI